MAFDYLKWQREYRKKTRNSVTNFYERTRAGKLMRTYRNMKSRVEGVLKKKAHLYFGLDLLDKEDFYNWSKNSFEFESLFLFWEASGFKKGLSPSIDRIDPSLGYELGNIRWSTHSHNSSNTRRHNG